MILSSYQIFIIYDDGLNYLEIVLRIKTQRYEESCGNATYLHPFRIIR